MSEIIIRNVRKEFDNFVAVQSSSFTIEDGEFFMLLGPSGCGKTTTLRMIAGLELPTSGEILIDGRDVSRLPASQRDIAFVFQMFALYPHMNVRNNIPETTFVAEFIGSPAMNLISFEGQLAAGDDAVSVGSHRVAVPQSSASASGKLVLGVRPEHVQLNDATSEGLAARVLAAEYLGTTQIVTLESDHGEVKARTAASTPVNVGENLRLGFDVRTLSLFDQADGKVIPSALHDAALSKTSVGAQARG